MNDADYMRLALALAERGRGWTAPNPMVGAVIVKDGAVIGQGWHERYGEPHAERNALAACNADPAGATMYVTLEPCCHHGKQPPCVDAILASGIRRVVIGSADPNPLVAGKGVAILRSHGVEVTENVLREECDALNKVFLHYITTGRPFVSMKYAMTMDGKIAAFTGASKWVTGETARSHVQQQRHRFRGIMVGVGTVLADDPLLTCRMENGRNPVRIICDTHLRTPPQAQVVATADQILTILATCCADPERQAVYQRAGCQVLCLNEENGHVDKCTRGNEEKVQTTSDDTIELSTYKVIMPNGTCTTVELSKLPASCKDFLNTTNAVTVESLNEDVVKARYVKKGKYIILEANGSGSTEIIIKAKKGILWWKETINQSVSVTVNETQTV